jgi:hypothetical protein
VDRHCLSLDCFSLDCFSVLDRFGLAWPFTGAKRRNNSLQPLRDAHGISFGPIVRNLFGRLVVKQTASTTADRAPFRTIIILILK